MAEPPRPRFGPRASGAAVVAAFVTLLYRSVKARFGHAVRLGTGDAPGERKLGVSLQIFTRCGRYPPPAVLSTRSVSIDSWKKRGPRSSRTTQRSAGPYLVAWAGGERMANPP